MFDELLRPFEFGHDWRMVAWPFGGAGLFVYVAGGAFFS
jgi:hypothetical protein